jgi:ABC-type phosphate transport system permease subunit
MKAVRKFPTGSLILISILCGAIWRFEVEFHGWSSLTWLYYFHFAIPFSFGVFIFWANSFLDVQLKKRLLVNISAILFGFLLYYLLSKSLTFIFANGVSGMMLLLVTPRWEFLFYRYMIFAIIPLIPMGTYFILKAFGLRAPLKSLLISILGVIISIPLSIFILDFIDHPGGGDLIHTIKSGILIPFWIFFVGLLVIKLKKNVLD